MPRRAAPLPPQAPILNVEQKRRRIERLHNCIRDLEAFDPQTVQKRYQIPEVIGLEAGIEDALSAAFGHGTPAYERYRAAATLDHGSHTMRADPMWGGHSEAAYDAQDAVDARRYLAEGKLQSIALLQQAIRSLESEIADQEYDATSAAPRIMTRQGRKVFVVHGHDEAARLAVARFLEQLDLEAIILNEQPDRGLTIIEKFEDCASDVGFAVVLLTPDDVAHAVAATQQAARARQNVIFELGYFAGKLGRGRACLLRKGEVEIPSDLYGVIYTEMDASDGWKLKLVREMKAAKLEFDANKVWG